MKDKRPIRADDMHALLRKRYDEQRNGWAYMAEVRDSTGASGGRSVADALALSLWPSRGIELHGHEIKVERSDWLRELKKASKGATVQRYCDRWWVVVSDAEIVRAGELPPTWGLMAVRSRGLEIVTQAPKLDRDEWTPVFIASVFRAVLTGIDRTHVTRQTHQKAMERANAKDDEIERLVEERLQERVKGALRMHSPRNTEAIERAAEAFQEATGKSITYYNGKQLAELVTVAERLKYLGLDHLLSTVNEITGLVTEAQAKIAALKLTASAHPVDGPTSTGDTAAQ